MRAIKTYDELIALPTFEERVAYLQEGSKVGEETFGAYRYINQQFYHGKIWLHARGIAIRRDKGLDLAMPGYDIVGGIYVHHLNPITIYDIINLTPYAIDPKYLICMSFDTHQIIHYGQKSLNEYYLVERTINDTCPWRR